MALVFRKAVLPKNVSLLKCLKGRPLATAANKKNPAVLSTSVPRRSLKDKARALRVGTAKIEKTKQLPSMVANRGRSETVRLRFCVSCPDFVPVSRTRYSASALTCSPKTRPVRFDSPLASMLLHRTRSLPCLVPCNRIHTSKTIESAKAAPSCPCGCPCPFPCGPCGCASGCNCLPPPCNTPPKCIQYMTGYYYYPYGFWFCGPYHVSGTCTPVGPCASCPSPSCPCAKCCACLDPVAASVLSSVTQPRPRHASPKSPRPFQSSAPSSPLAPNIKCPLQDAQCNATTMTPSARPPAGGSSISKFFPFNGIPSLDSMGHLPHSSLLLCPFSSQSTPPSKEMPSGTYPQHAPVYCTPCFKQSKSNFSTRPRPPLTSNWQKPKKSLLTAFAKSYSGYYDKRAENRNRVQHKRSKKLCDVCPLLDSPRGLMTQEQRDKPAIFPGSFQYANIPSFRNPQPRFGNNVDYKAYDA